MPPFSIPLEFFDQLRRDLRAQSGVPYFHPSDPAIPDLQPYESCVSQVDPCPPYLRCRNCKGRLLRGVNSVFCVFCGKEVFGDVMPDPLNFRDSQGCAWLLQALGLDGSESVSPLSGEDEPSREKDRFKDEIRLSDLLSQEIKWTAPAEKPADSGRDDSALKKGYLSLGGADLENVFGEETNEFRTSSSEKKSGADEASHASESNITLAPSNLSLFGNVTLPSTSINSTDYENSSFTSAWDAEFQSGGSETAQKVSLFPDPFPGSSVDMSSHMDAMFGTGNEQKISVVKSSSSDMDNWFDDNPRSNSNIVFIGKDLGSKPSDDTGPKPSSSDMDNWFDDDPRDNSNIGFDRQDWGPKPSHDGGPQPSSSGMDDWFNDDLRGNSSIGFNGQDFVPKPSHDAMHSGITEGPSKPANVSTWIEDNQWLSHSTGASKSDRSDEDDAWNDFTSSTNEVDYNVWKHGDDVATSYPTPPADLFSSSSDMMMDFEFSRRDLSPGASGITMQPVNLSPVQTQASSLDRVVLHVDSEETSEEIVKPEGGMNATSGESDQLHMLMSQMHDLSFMLDSNLSIPSLSGNPIAWEK